MKLSKNFSLAELTKSQTATRMGRDNNPSMEEQENLRLLCERVLQPIRDHFNHPVLVTSGYRNQWLKSNAEIVSRKIGSSDESQYCKGDQDQHCNGEAADFKIVGTPNNEVADWIKENLVFDQLILEYSEPGQLNKGTNPSRNCGWIHVSYNKDLNRKEYLMTIKNAADNIEYKLILGLSTDRYVKYRSPNYWNEII